MTVVKGSSDPEQLVDLSDAQLIELCLKGNQGAWEAVIRRYQNLIYSVPIHYHFSAHDSADIFQHVCVTLLEKLKTLRNTQTLSSWLYVTTKRQCWRILKKQRRETELESSHILAAENSGEDLVLQHQIKSGVEKLSEKCKELITALYYSDPPMTYDQITEKLGVPFGSIGPTRARCLEKLKKILSGED